MQSETARCGSPKHLVLRRVVDRWIEAKPVSGIAAFSLIKKCSPPGENQGSRGSTAQARNPCWAYTASIKDHSSTTCRIAITMTNWRRERIRAS
jgi:hypothetical protein